MTKNERQIFSGTLLITTDNVLLKEADDRPFVDVSFAFENDLLDRQEVSILGRLDERIVSADRKVRSIIADKVVSHSAIAKRAYAIYTSGRGTSAVDDWLRAERELLEF